MLASQQILREIEENLKRNISHMAGLDDSWPNRLQWLPRSSYALSCKSTVTWIVDQTDSSNSLEAAKTRHGNEYLGTLHHTHD